MTFRYIYGPVASWRLGRSLGVDLISTEEKVCSFDCTYCQVGPTCELTCNRRVFVATDVVMGEIEALPRDIAADYITFSGMGEPTLAANVGEVIQGIKAQRAEPVCVLTNSSLIGDPAVRGELARADRVIAKLDAATQGTFGRVNHPLPGLALTSVIRGLCAFREMYRGQFDLQMMFVEDNEGEARDMAELARVIRPDEVELNTPLRPPATGVLSPARLAAIQECFHGLSVRSVYEATRSEAKPLDIHETARRR